MADNISVFIRQRSIKPKALKHSFCAFLGCDTMSLIGGYKVFQEHTSTFQVEDGFIDMSSYIR
jgi:hypothetical protein